MVSIYERYRWSMYMYKRKPMVFDWQSSLGFSNIQNSLALVWVARCICAQKRNVASGPTSWLGYVRGVSFGGKFLGSVDDSVGS